MPEHPSAKQDHPDAIAEPEYVVPGKRRFPNVPVLTHTGKSLRFFDDLIEGRTVVVNFVSIASEAEYPVTKSLARVARLLGDRLGRDVHMYSISTDPDRDTPEALARFAARHQVPEGWLFLTGDPRSLEVLRRAFFVHPDGHGHLAAREAGGRAPAEGAGGRAPRPASAPRDRAADEPDCSLGLVRYGNEPSGLWAAAPARNDPALLVERLSWVQPRPAPSRPRSLRRGGPHRPVA